MTQEQYNRAVQIGERLSNLQKVKEEIDDEKKHRLTYIERRSIGDYEICNEYRMRLISEILDKHDNMIRTEIEEEIERLIAEIETL